ncbi:MAG: stage 0 sporulation family protein [Lachnospiraceae bacterium]|nr:stage 0 sporulation family protein [Lachnospiraceae bacterium]
MIKVTGVRFRGGGKTYYFDPGEFELSPGMSVVVETARGTEVGMVSMSEREIEEEELTAPLKSVTRIASHEDFEILKANKEKEKEAFRICREKINAHGLEMKLVDVEYAFEGNKILFYFTADGRIDFRDLVKDLASVFKTRIELRQIGVRDETKMLGGIGICGRVLCCHSYLSDFAPVSIKMAKEQNLSLNPSKISGVCGRLMCCLKNEEDTYEYLNSRLPSVGEMVTVPADGVEGTVNSVNVLRQTVKVLIKTDGGDIEMKEYPVDGLDFGPDRKPPVPVTRRPLPDISGRNRGKAVLEETIIEEEIVITEEVTAVPEENGRQNGEKQNERRRRPYRRRRNQDAKKQHPDKRADGERKPSRPREKQ